MSQILYFLVEGPDDERFIERVVKPLLERHYSSVPIFRYARMAPSKVRTLIKSIHNQNDNYLLFGDLDDGPCVTSQKINLRNRFEFLNDGRIVIVSREIESWYYAGLSGRSCKRIGIQKLEKTDNLIKEQFNSLVSEKFSDIDNSMVEILNHFDLDEAKKKNTSFAYFLRKHIARGQNR